MLRTTYLHHGWQFAEKSWQSGNHEIGITKTEWLPATVPGHVHVDLVDNGIIGHPFERQNEIGCQWVDEKDWSYRTTFDWSPDPELPRRLLRFEGLDTICQVLLNGKLVGKTENMFVPLEIDVTDFLVSGQNELQVDFQSAVNVGIELQRSYLTDESLAKDTERFVDRSFVRKAQYMFGWDWGPRLVSCGIWRPVSIVEYQARILDVHVAQTHLDDGSVQLHIKTEVENLASDLKVVHLLATGGEVPEDEPFIIDEPELWWPNGMGEQTGFQILTFITSEEDALLELDHRETWVGLCKVELLREVDKWGESFEFKVNGKNFWARGANWIPDHSFPSLVTRQRYREQLERCIDMGFNMLRVWGGGLYEMDEFYEICDELGILVWQDFPFACAYYPDNEHWQEIVKAEAATNIKRIRNHPCLAIWCGNNENLEMHVNKWGGADKHPSRYYGENLYDRTLPNILAELDPHRPYIASSPIGNAPTDDPKIDKYKGPNAGRYGDQHCWDVWHGRGDWKFYGESEGRFSSEYGFASSCCTSLWEKTLTEEDWSPTSPTVRWHDKTGKGTDTFVGYVKLHYPDPVTLEDWVYYSQLNQRDALRFGVEHYRRSEYCKGSLIWQLNDCWPVQSWAILDSEGNYKALAYELRRLHADVMLSIVRVNDTITVWAVNDGIEPAEGFVSARATNLQTGELLGEWETESVELAPSERKSVLEFSVSGLAVPDVLISSQGFDDATAWSLLAEPKAARHADPLPILISNHEDGLITVKIEAPVVDLMFTSEGSPAPFQDNFVTWDQPGVYYLACESIPDTIEARSLSGAHVVKKTRSPL